MQDHADIRDALPDRSGEEERDYLLSRAEAHRQLAKNAAETETRAIHTRLQQLYTERAHLIEVVVTDYS